MHQFGAEAAAPDALPDGGKPPGWSLTSAQKAKAETLKC
jgi:hypothetical protein